MTAVVAAAAAAHVEATLLTTRDGRVRAAGSRWLSHAQSNRLARSRATDVRTKLAGNPAISAQAATRLANQHTDPWVAQTALANPACPYPVVATHPDGIPVQHPDCPADLLEQVLMRPDRRQRNWRHHALSHPRLPEHLRDALITDPHSDLYDLRQLLENPATSHIQALAIFDRVPSGRRSTDEWVWAQHPAADPSWLADLADRRFDSSDQGTLAHIAANPATPPAVLARIVERHYHRLYALANPSCPPEAMHGRLDATPDTDRLVSESYYRDQARTIACNPATPPAVLARIPAGHVTGHRLFHFTLAHTTTGDQARTILALAAGWAGNLADLLNAAAAVAA